MVENNRLFVDSLFSQIFDFQVDFFAQALFNFHQKAKYTQNFVPGVIEISNANYKAR